MHGQHNIKFFHQLRGQISLVVVVVVVVVVVAAAAAVVLVVIVVVLEAVNIRNRVV